MKKYIISFVLALVGLSSYSQATFLSVAGGGTWSSSSTWILFSGSDADGVPDADDIVFIINTSGNINITSNVIVRDLHVIFNRAGNVRKTGFGGAVTITIHGQLLGDDGAGTPTVPTADVINDANLSFIFDGSNLNTSTTPVITTWGSVATLQNISFSPASLATTLYTDSFSVESSGVLTVTNGTLLVNNSNTLEGNGTITINSGTTLSIEGSVSGGSTSTNFPTININGVVTVESLGYLNVNTINLNSGGTLNVTNNQTNGWWHSLATSPTFTANSNSTVSYNRGSNQGVGALTYGNLSISSGGPAATKTLSSTGTLDVLGDLTIAGSNTFSTSSNTGNITFRGDITNDGILDVTRPTTFTGGATHIVGGVSTTTFSGAVTVNSSNTMDFNSAVVFGSTLTTGSNNMSFAGNVTHAGAFNNTGTIIFDGSTAQSFAGAGSASFSNFTISNTSSSTATINNANTDVTGTLTMSANARLNANGNVTLVSTGTGSAATARVATIPASATVSGNFIYERYISGAQQWHNIGLPISGSIADITSSGYPDPNASLGGDFVRYNEAIAGGIDLGWESSKLPFSAIADTQGYTFWTRTADNNRTLQVTGALNTGIMNFPITRTVQNGLADDGWNLVNNPYASQVDWASGSWTKTNIDVSIYVWNGSAYNTLNGSGIIASGQSFWVHANAASPVLTATQSVKTSSSATFFREGEDSINDLTIKLNDGVNTDLARIRFMDLAIEEFDSQYDGYKLKNDIYNLSSITEAGMDLSINTIPLIENYRKVKLNITNIGVGSYDLEFEDVSSFDIEVTLVDHFLNKEESLKDGYVYSFAVTSDTLSYGSERFELIFGKQQTITAVITDELSDPIRLFPNPVGDQELTIEATDLSSYQSILMYNSQGKLMTTLTIDSESEIKIDMSRFDKGIYFIHLTGEKGSAVHKILKN